MDGGSIISKIIELKKGSKVQFECTHVKSKNETEEANNNEGKTLLLLCDMKSKEERLKCEENCKYEKISTRGNIGIKYAKKNP